MSDNCRYQPLNRQAKSLHLRAATIEPAMSVHLKGFAVSIPVSVDKINEVLKYTCGGIRPFALAVYQGTGSLRALEDYVQRLYEIGIESQQIEGASAVACYDDDYPLTVGDMYLDKKLREVDPKFVSDDYIAWRSRDFARRCEKMLIKLRAFSGSILSPHQEMARLESAVDGETLETVFERNCRRRNSSVAEDESFRYGLYLGLRAALNSVPGDDSPDLIELLADLSDEFSPSRLKRTLKAQSGR